MGNKDRYFYLELFLTFCLLLLVIFLFGDLLSTLRLYLIVGLLCGFFIGLLIRDRQNQLISLFINLGTLAILAWIIYSIINSTFLYRDVLLICIKAIFILEVIFSLNVCEHNFLNYIQTLSIPLFMGHAVFIKDNYNQISIILALGYIAGLFFIFKIKFYGLLKQPDKRNIRRYYSIFLSVIFFLIFLLFAWSLFLKFPFREFRKGGLFLEEGSGQEIADAANGKEYYDIQDKTQEEIIRLIPKFDSTEERYEILGFLSTLIKESPHSIDVDKAEQGLISHFKKLGPGINKRDREELTSLIRNYLDRKIAMNLERSKTNIAEILKRYPFKIKDRISILYRANKLRFSNSNQKVNKYVKKLRESINNSSLDNNVKRELKEPAGQLKQWKILQIYRQKINSLYKNINTLEKASKTELTDLLAGIKQQENRSDFKEGDKKLEKLKDTALPQFKGLIEKIEESSGLRFDMALSKKGEKLKEKLEASSLNRNKALELKEGADNIQDAEDYQVLSQNSADFKERASEENIDISEETKELLGIKTYDLAKDKKEKIKNLVRKSLSSNKQKKALTEKLERLGLSKDSEEIMANAKKLKTSIDRFLEQGFISKKNRDNLVKELEELKNLLLFQSKAIKKEPAKQIISFNVQQEWEEMLERSTLGEETKQRFRKLIEKLSQADTLSEVEDIKQEVEKEIESLSKHKMREEAERFKNAFESVTKMKKMHAIDKSLSDLIKDIEKLRETKPQESRILKEYIRKIRNSSTEEEFRKTFNALQEYIKSKESEVEGKLLETGDFASWQIYIIPSRVILPPDSSVSLRAIAVYNKLFVKELGSELEWFSSNPNVAWVTKGGLIYSLSKGRAKIGATYRGKIIEAAEVIVVEKIAEEIVREIRNCSIR